MHFKVLFLRIFCYRNEFPNGKSGININSATEIKSLRDTNTL
ncbi:hypothetical protein SAMN05444144_107216 [Flavobacterium akiainvivens]|nr:hypothetical protein SAMN05444144_107216 [Flavobacterium akiainvivens]